MKGLLLALIVLLIAGSGAVFFAAGDRSSAGAERVPGSSPLDAEYDYYIQDMLATRFDSAGRAVSQLQAARVTHYPEGDRAELESPAFKSFGVQSDAWQVSAETGTLAPDVQRGEDRLDLAGSVELHKPLANADFVDVQTTELTVFTGSEELATAAPVALQMRGTRLEFVGMQARLAENYFKTNDGEGLHEPATRP